MGSLFDLDAPIWVWMAEIADIMILSLLWWTCSIPIITAGASTTSLFYVLGKKVRKEPVYVVKDFFKSFKDNFKQSIPLTIIMIIAWTSSILYIFMLIEGVLSGDVVDSLKWIFPVSVLFVFETINLSTYLCAVFSRFDMKTSQLLKTTFLLVHKHLLTTFMITGIYILVILLIIRIPLLIVVAPGIIVVGVSFIIQKIFAQYMPADEEQKEAEQEVIQEIEENGGIKEENNYLEETEIIN